MLEADIIIKEEIDIDDTEIKLELDVEESETDSQLSCGKYKAGSGMLKIIEERPNMITVPLNEHKSEDEINFIATLDQQKKVIHNLNIYTHTHTADCDNLPLMSLQLFGEIESETANETYKCDVCSFKSDNLMLLASHNINHFLNRHFCRYGCGYCGTTLEEMLDHEFRKHEGGRNKCRICAIDCQDSTGLAKHMNSHFFVRRFVCALCCEHFETRQSLVLHRQNNPLTCGRLQYLDMQDNVGQLVAASKMYGKLTPIPQGDVQIKEEPMDTDQPELEQPMLADIEIKAEPMEPIQEPQNNLPISLSQLRSKLRLPAIKKAVQPQDSTATVVPKQCNILRIKKFDNQQVTLKSNALKLLPNNCMLIKLPPNTKIVRLAPNVNNNNNNSQKPNLVMISANSNVPNAAPAPTAAATSTPSPPANKGLTTSMSKRVLNNLNLNRNACFNAIDLYESLPESRKIIEDIQNKIRSIEQTLPLPGSVLQKTTQNSEFKCNINKEDLPPKVLMLALNNKSHEKVNMLRNTFKSFRFHWECPKCGRCYEVFPSFYSHLQDKHGLSKEELQKTLVTVKSFKKQEFLSPSTATTVPAEETKPAAAVAAPPVTSTKAAETITANSATPAPAATSATVATLAAVPKPKASASADDTSTSTTNSTVQRAGEIRCEQCSKTYTTVGGLRIHMLIHTGELPHKCNYCEKRFRTPGQVRVHHRRHTGEKPFKCKICSLDFTHRETLISHLSRHIGMKRYKCYGCDKYFVVVSGLRAHRRLRPDTCGKVKFTARAHGPRVRVIKGEVVFEPQPEHNGYLRSEDPLNILSEIQSNDAESAEDEAAMG
ncbi:zinc finger protein 236 isoform X1 [Drosophila busckii]|uniref:zinc finger protein 236 isoform X1 n=1 Tax=Drosophila busckii TaxID=30019 RepID=UPI001433230C|nr:zinc finger protein 236 isoform X1 [Drosophila busckii]